MARDDQRLGDVVLMSIVRLNAIVHGLVAGALAGAAIFVATNVLVLKGGPVVGPHLALLGQFLPGYRVTFVGSVVGLAYGLVLGFVFGYVVATLYNLVAGRVARKRPGHA